MTSDVPHHARRRNHHGIGVEPAIEAALVIGQAERLSAGAGPLTILISHRVPAARNISGASGLEGDDQADLPTTHNGIGNGAQAGAEAPAFSERQLIEHRGDHALRYVEAGNRSLATQVTGRVVSRG